MHVVVLGSGAVGFTYGLPLLEAEWSVELSELNVSFISRRDCDLILQHGIRLIVEHTQVTDFSPEKLANKVFPSVEQLVHSKGQADWIIVCVKTYALPSLRIELQLLSHEKTKILLIMNGLGMEDVLAEFIPPQNLFGAVAYIGANRGPNPPLDPGPLVIDLFKMLNLEIGHYLDNKELLQDSVDLWNRTKISSKVTHVDNLLKTRWSKLCWNLAFSGIAVAMGGLTTDVIINDSGLAKLADEIITDSIHVANADINLSYLNRFPDSSASSDFPDNLLIDMETHRHRLWAAAHNVGKYKASTVLDLIEGKDMETDFMFSEVLRRARRAQKQDNRLSYSKLECIITMVEAMDRIKEQKKALRLISVPTLFNS